MTGVWLKAKRGVDSRVRDRDWDSCLARLGLAGAALVWTSGSDPSRRVYARDHHVYKVRLLQHDCSGHLRAQTLAGEASILEKAKGIARVPQVHSHFVDEEVEMLVISRLPGSPLQCHTMDTEGIVRVLAQIGLVLGALSLRGIAHRDVRPTNVLVENGGGAYLVDFDQSVVVTIPKAFAANFLGLRTKGTVPVHGSLLTLIKYHVKTILRPKRYSLPSLPRDASESLRLMHQAWEIGRVSNASAPGDPVAYYAFEFEGVSFPGERSWIDRWRVLRGATEFRGKRVLELGCNMALLSAHLLRECGAESVTAVDHDADVLRSAALVAEALGAKVSFQCLDFDAVRRWEDDIPASSYDIVFALNVLNWVADKPRLIRFLSGFPEVIFEGHDSCETEVGRFAEAGFNDWRLLGYSERERPVLKFTRK